MSNLPSSPRLRDEDQAAAFLGLKSGQTLAKWRCCRRGDPRYALPFVRIGGRIFYREEDLLAFIEASTVKP